MTPTEAINLTLYNSWRSSGLFSFALMKGSFPVGVCHGKCEHSNREKLIFSARHFLRKNRVFGRILYFKNPVKYTRIFEINQSKDPQPPDAAMTFRKLIVLYQ